jgi:hypothetical protein
MSFDAFIKMEGIGGEALDDKHKGWIEITGYNFGSHQSTTATASSTGGRLIWPHHAHRSDIHEVSGQRQLQTDGSLLRRRTPEKSQAHPESRRR